MLGERSGQRGRWEADQLYLDMVGRETFYGVLASLRGHLCCDTDFTELYCLDNGRTSVPSSLLATALLLQTYDKASDAEAKGRADFDLRWKVALGIEMGERPFAQSTLQMCLAQLILRDKVRGVFEQSLRLAPEAGYLQPRGMRVVLDTTYILGRGARGPTVRGQQRERGGRQRLVKPAGAAGDSGGGVGGPVAAAGRAARRGR